MPLCKHWSRGEKKEKGICSYEPDFNVKSVKITTADVCEKSKKKKLIITKEKNEYHEKSEVNKIRSKQEIFFSYSPKICWANFALDIKTYANFALIPPFLG